MVDFLLLDFLYVEPAPAKQGLLRAALQHCFSVQVMERKQWIFDNLSVYILPDPEKNYGYKNSTAHG